MQAEAISRERAARAWGEPPPAGTVRVTALGGLGQVGMNCLCIDQRDERLLIDCGITFPPSAHGVERLEPPLELLEQGRMRIVGLVLTHGHEDHIGAVPSLLARHALGVWGPPHALELVRSRLAEQAVALGRAEESSRPALVPLRAGERAAIGSFRLEAIAVAHSIAEAIALSIETDAGRIVHSGDFTLRGSGAHRSATDTARLAELGAAGVRLLCADSTNVEVAVPGPDEPTVAAALGELVRQAPRRVVVGHFASNVHRMATVAELAASSGRELCVVGRSMERHLGIGLELGQVRLPPGQPISAALSRERLAPRLLIAASGTQAEHRGALRRLALGEHPELGLEPGDLVVLSARTIPGNERAVGQMVDAFWRRGVSVVTPAERPGLHASGHASAAELAELVGLVRPAILLPVHGARHQLERLAALGRELGVGEAVVRENGQPLLCTACGPVAFGPAMDAAAVPFGAEQRLAAAVLADRRRIGRGGVVSVSTAAGPNGTWQIDVQGVGLALVDDDRRAVGAACLAALGPVLPAAADAPGLERRLRRAVTATIRTRGLGRPVIVVSLVGLGSSPQD